MLIIPLILFLNLYYVSILIYLISNTQNLLQKKSGITMLFF